MNAEKYKQLELRLQRLYQSKLTVMVFDPSIDKFTEISLNENEFRNMLEQAKREYSYPTG